MLSSVPVKRESMLSEIKETMTESVVSRTFHPRKSPLCIMQNRHSFESMNQTISNEIRRKTFREFFQSHEHHYFSEPKRQWRREVSNPGLVVSYDHIIRPIHSRSHSSDLNQEDRQSRPVIKKPKIHLTSFSMPKQTLQFRRPGCLQMVGKNGKKEVKIRSAKPSYLKKLGIRMKFADNFLSTNSNLEFTPWTKRQKEDINLARRECFTTLNLSARSITLS